ncbi:MAG: adenine-specific DNA-methyltransferase [Acidimicrobiaceae bacterium]|nr:adenine-specific DNA-methyltransferase [Acidimicrobiaceae bacterium]
MALLEDEGLDAHLIPSDVFAIPTPDEFGSALPLVDAVVGNPPFVRYQEHRGAARQRSIAAALKQGVRLSGLASSWASVVVHSSGFLKPDGRLAMVLPAELLTVHYAEPIRRWLRHRFAGVTLVMFERLQFDDALEKVVLLLAHGSGGCDSFSLVYVEDASDLASLHFGDSVSVTPASEGKWTDLLLPLARRRRYREVVASHFLNLSQIGSVELGTVTGANHYFALSEAARHEYGLTEELLRPICPPGSRHLRGTTFTKAHWERLKAAGERVWLLCPEPEDETPSLRRYVERGEREGVNQAYKCQVRSPWWRPPVVAPPDLFFTYMSHRYPRFVRNTAKTSLLNSMHGVRLKRDTPRAVGAALPLLALNSVTMLGAEIHGRAYGGGMLKMEPREALSLPVPSIKALLAAWDRLKAERQALDRQLQDGLWTNVAKRVDEVLLHETIGLPLADVAELHDAAASLRERRLGQ